MTDFEWAAECRFVSRITDRLRDGRGVGENFDRDPRVFLAFVNGRIREAAAAGRDDSATYLQECADDVLVYLLGGA